MKPDEMRLNSQTLAMGNERDAATGWLLVIAAELCERWDRTNELLEKIEVSLKGIDINGMPNPNG